MFKIGLCSVTFRDLTVGEVMNAAKKADISGIEWGGDYHVPPGDLQQAEKTADLMDEFNLETVAYGSYYRAGYDSNKFPFETVLSTAIKLRAPAIRIWGGRLGSEEADQSNRNKVAVDIRRIADMARKYQIKINIEYHARSLTDTPESAKKLLQDINHPNVYLYWQPAIGETTESRLESIKMIKPWLSHVHVFHWWGTDRFPFEKGVDEWSQYLAQMKLAEGDRYLLLEFVKDDKLGQFYQDVEKLKTLIKNI